MSREEFDGLWERVIQANETGDMDAVMEILLPLMSGRNLFSVYGIDEGRGRRSPFRRSGDEPSKRRPGAAVATNS